MQGGAELREGSCASQEEHVSLEERSAQRLSAQPAAVPRDQGSVRRRGPNQSVDGKKKTRHPSRPHTPGLLVFFLLEQIKACISLLGLEKG